MERITQTTGTLFQLYANPNLRLQIFAPSQSPHVYANQHDASPSQTQGRENVE
ncbi:4459_t:CDS:2 [Rhizophagus irregularis]|uniref:Uncharacterized protein n=2 Tax=Rhizophagus irregularis TaxID=588596 RepID=A0A015JAT5_RHIIW|nr:hypothetical protein RirG_122060 [Rhizophagus irregularis DAOM 197198w]CAG8730167.1 4459_t:CDS:2 [Rhizophagus irregularis]